MTKAIWFGAVLLLLNACLKERTEGVDGPQLDQDFDAAAMAGDGDRNGAAGSGQRLPWWRREGAFDAPPPTACKRGCTHALASRCDEELDLCVPCARGEQCAGQGPRAACIAGVGCFECSEDVPCSDHSLLCDPKLHACVECFEGSDWKCSAKGKVCNLEQRRCVTCLDDSFCRDKGQRGVCDTATGRCVECTEDADCGDPEKARCEAHECVGCASQNDCAHLTATPHCLADEKRCVECFEPEHCDSAREAVCGANHRCEPCASSQDCAHFAAQGGALPICLEGQCVECTSSERKQCNGKVCSALDHACTDFAPLSAGVCESCVSDLQCEAGSVCVMTTFIPPLTGAQPSPEPQEAGWYCQPKIGVNEGCVSRAPYVSPRTSGHTVDGIAFDGPGEPFKVCTLAVSTCPAHDDFRKLSVPNQCGVPGSQVGGPAVVGDDSKCGDPRFDDGYCVPFDANVFVCSVACGDALDCPTQLSAPCTPQSHGDLSKARPLCSVK